jgi:hypothetical protein
MGWLQFSMHRPVKEWFKDECLGDNSEALDIAIVKRNTLYAAIKDKTTGQVFCAVFMLRWSRNYHYNFAYKAMDEFVGPCEVECPERIFKLLTPLTDEDDPNGWARKWRKSVQEYHETRKAMKGNFVFKSKQPIEFTNGQSFQYFKKEGRTIYAGVMKQNEFYSRCKVRIRGLYTMDFEKIKVAN